MTFEQSLRNIILFLVMMCAASGCSQKPSGAAKEKPAVVEAYPNEVDVFRIVLTAKAEERLQISTVAAVMKSVPRHRSIGGEIVIPDGQRIPVTAPLTGTLLQAEQPPVAAGQHVTINELLLRLTPMLPPEREVPNAAERVQMANARATLISAQIQADGDMKQAMAEVEAANIAVARAKQLLADKAGSARAVDESEATRNIAGERLKAATERKTLLDKLTLEAETGEVPVVSIRAPHDGIVQTVSARIGQVVNAGAVLFEIVDLNQLWVRVPVYAGQVREIETSLDAGIRGLSNVGDEYPARPIEAPPSANPLAASVDLFYEVDNADGRFRPGERVYVRLPLKGDAESLVVPRAAILRDIHGTAWVYVKTAEHEYRRKRAAVQFTTDDLAVLSLGPEIGAEVVVDGAAELFGTEFGAGK